MCIRNMNKEGLNPIEQASSKRDRIEALACMGGAEERRKHKHLLLRKVAEDRWSVPLL